MIRPRRTQRTETNHHPVRTRGVVSSSAPLDRHPKPTTEYHRRITPNILSREFDVLSNTRDKRVKCDSPMTSGGGFTWCQPVLKMPVSPVQVRESPLKMTNKDTAPRQARGAVFVYETSD